MKIPVKTVADTLSYSGFMGSGSVRFGLTSGCPVCLEFTDSQYSFYSAAPSSVPLLPEGFRNGKR